MDLEGMMVNSNDDALSAWIVAGALLAGLAIFTLMPGITATSPVPVTDVSIRGAAVAASDWRGERRESQMSLEGFAADGASDQMTETVPDGDGAGLGLVNPRGLEIAC